MEKRYYDCIRIEEKHGAPYQSAVRWARKSQIPGVEITQFGKFKIYMIPEDAKPAELPTGRPPKKEREKKAGAKKTAAKKAKKAKKEAAK